MRYKPFAEDVYPLPTLNHSLQHDHQQHKQHNNPDPAETAQLDIFSAEPPMTEIFTSPTAGPSTEAQSIPTPVEVIPTLSLSGNPVIPPINAYGTFSHTSNPGTPHHHIAHRSFSTSSTDSSVSTDDENRMLLPSHVPRKEGVMNNVSGDLIPFANVFGHFFRGLLFPGRCWPGFWGSLSKLWFEPKEGYDIQALVQQTPQEIATRGSITV